MDESMATQLHYVSEENTKLQAALYRADRDLKYLAGSATEVAVLTARCKESEQLLRDWLEETGGDDEAERVRARKLLGLPKGWPHAMADNATAPEPRAVQE